MIRFMPIAMPCGVVSPMLSADNKLRVRSIQCAPDSSQANSRAFSIHEIVAIAAREHEACVLSFMDAFGNAFLFGIIGHVMG